MIKLNGVPLPIEHFYDGALRIKPHIVGALHQNITWHFENNEELVSLIFLTKHLRSHGAKDIRLEMPYIPNARQDRVKDNTDVFTLKYFAEVINSLGFSSVSVLDPHSYVSEALIDRVNVSGPEKYVRQAIGEIKRLYPATPLMLFYPDEGAMKRYSEQLAELGYPYAYGIKSRDWKTGHIKDLLLQEPMEPVDGKNILIVDDICSKGGTFLRAAQALHKHGAKDVFLYVSHCENTILQGSLIASDEIKTYYTTDSIFTVPLADRKKEIVVFAVEM